MRSTLPFTDDSKVILLRPADDGYEDARVIWNGMFDRTPGLIARCADVSDVQSAGGLRLRPESLPPSVWRA